MVMRPLARVVEPREELRDRRLPGARVSHECDCGRRRDVEVERVEDVGQAAVSEADVLGTTWPRISGSSRAAGASTTSGSSSNTTVIRSSAAVAARKVL